MSSMRFQGAYKFWSSLALLYHIRHRRRSPPYGSKEQTQANSWARGSASASCCGTKYGRLSWWRLWWSILIPSYIPFFVSHETREAIHKNILFSMLVFTNNLLTLYNTCCSKCRIVISWFARRWEDDIWTILLLCDQGSLTTLSCIMLQVVGSRITLERIYKRTFGNSIFESDNVYVPTALLLIQRGTTGLLLKWRWSLGVSVTLSCWLQGRFFQTRYKVCNVHHYKNKGD